MGLEAAQDLTFTIVSSEPNQADIPYYHKSFRSSYTGFGFFSDYKDYG